MQFWQVAKMNILQTDSRNIKLYLFLLEEYEDIQNYLADSAMSDSDLYVTPISTDEKNTVLSRINELKFKVKCNC